MVGASTLKAGSDRIIGSVGEKQLFQAKAKTFLGHPKLNVGFFVGCQYDRNEKALNNQGLNV